MNKFYDKLILVIAVLALGGGAAVYVLKTGQIPAKGGASAVISSEQPYEQVPSTKSTGTSVEWPSPEAQSTNWVYDVFTPPKIYLDENREFTTDQMIIAAPSKFGVYLAEIVRKPYRIQIQGYIEEDRRDSMKSMLLLFDEERSTPIRIRPGSEDETAEIKVVNFKVDRQINAEEGKVEVTATATILDQRTGKEVTLVDGVRLYEDESTIRIRSRLDSEFSVELSKVGETFEGPVGSYELLEINLDASSVTLEKEATEENEAVTQTLTVANTSAAPIEDETGATQTFQQPQNSPFPF